MPSVGESTTAVAKSPAAVRSRSWRSSCSPMAVTAASRSAGPAGDRPAAPSAARIRMPSVAAAASAGAPKPSLATARAIARSSAKSGESGSSIRMRRAGDGQVGHQGGRVEHQQRREQHLEPGRAGDREQVGGGLVDPLERLGDAQLSLPPANRSNIGGGRRSRPEPGAGIVGPPFALADEEHKVPELLHLCVGPGDGVVEPLEPDEDVDIRLRHRARLPNHRSDRVIRF